MALYAGTYAQYQPRFEPGLHQDYLPTSLQDAKRFLTEKDRWR